MTLFLINWNLFYEQGDCTMRCREHLWCLNVIINAMCHFLFYKLHTCSTETRHHYDKLGFSCYSWHPLWCLLDKKYLVPAESVDYLTKVALQCIRHRHVGCSLFFWLLSILCYSSFLSFSFYLSESLLIWNKTPFCLCSKSLYLQKGMAPFD